MLNLTSDGKEVLSSAAYIIALTAPLDQKLPNFVLTAKSGVEF
jgi:hypothetical protein